MLSVQGVKDDRGGWFMKSQIGNQKSKMSHRHGVTSYWERTQWPLQSLYFLLPLLIGYEIGTVMVAPEVSGGAGAASGTSGGGGRLPAIYAERLLVRFFVLFGATGYYLPGFLVVGVLLGMHVVRRDPWRVELKLYVGMLVESVIWAVPLFVLGTLFSGSGGGEASGASGVLGGGLAGVVPALQSVVQGGVGLGMNEGPLARGMVFSVGAGIYEELMFRVIGIAVLHLLLDDFLALPKQVGQWGAITGSALLFAAYHFGEHNPFEMGRFVFYTLAGLYFAVLYVGRGFGVVVATHALYDVFAVVSQFQDGV